jgi:hypothetical protein
MTLFQVEELASYWADHPPLYLLVGAYLGFGKETHKRMPSTSIASGGRGAADLSSVLARLGPRFGAGDVHAGLTPVVLDFAELRRRTTASD